jgi:hypothetical protein
MYGGKPVVMIFARKSDAALASLVKQLDKALAEHEGKKLQAFVNLLGDDREALEDGAARFSTENEVQLVAITVPVEFENGPADFGINPEAEVTVMLYKGAKVQSNHAFGEGALDDKGIEAILADLPKILK